MSKNQCREFIARLTGHADNPVHWQIYHDSNKSDDGKKLARNFYKTYSDAEVELKKSQLYGCGVYITVNETDGFKRTTESVTSARACFIDGDNQDLPADWGVYPHIVVARNPRHWHAYWLLDPTTDLKTWSEMQYKLALYYGVKDRLADYPRVMRAPGFEHLKNPREPELYNTEYNNIAAKYTLGKLLESHPLSQEQQQEFDGWKIAPKEKSTAADVVNDSDLSIQKFINRISHIQPEKGNYNNTLYIAAQYGKDYGLSAENVRKYITKWWANSWEIPVEVAAIHSVVNNAYRYGNNAVGSETSAAKFKAMPPLVEQVGSAEDLRTVVAGVETSDVKYGKNHSINSRLFVQSNADNGIHYLTYQQETYIYSGTHWRRLEPDELKQHVLEAMLNSRPGMDVINGSTKMVELLTANNKIKKIPSWLGGDCKDNPKNFIAFKNGILDIKNNVWRDHTPELFYTFCVDYDYDHSATCSGWVNYLNTEVFNADQSLIMIVQEWMGYMLSQSYDYQKIAVFLGAPRSGKGTICGVLRHLVGSNNVAAPSLSRLIKDSTLDGLQDKPVAIVGEAQNVPFNLRDLVVEHLKMISGCDPMTYDRKYKSANTAKLPTRFTLCCNKIPEFLDSSGALASRLIIIPFRNSYLGREDPNRLEKLLVEAPGILNWALEGLRRLQSNGRFTESRDSDEIMEVIKGDLSPVGLFMDDCINVTQCKDDFEPVVAIYGIYKRWCDLNDVKPFGKTKFSSDFKSVNYHVRQRKRRIHGQGETTIFTGITVTNNLHNICPGNFPTMEDLK